jgi:SAM-dependent methyltransferase
VTELRTATEVLADTVGVDGLDVLDVGCGAGDLVRWLRRHGARPVGVECGAEMRARAIADDPDHADDYVDAGGQKLPFDDHTFDLVVYSYSLHHVPVPELPTALAEARRVLGAGGTLYVVEPEPISPDNAVAYPVVDERIELAAAQAALDDLPADMFVPGFHATYVSEATYASFEAWTEMIVGVDRHRAAKMEQHRDRLHDQFHAMGARGPEGLTFRRGNTVRTFVTELA